MRVSVLDSSMERADLNSLLRSANEAWPELRLDPAGFASYLRQRLPAAPTQASLAGLHATDLYLAAACVANDPVALATFDRVYLQPLPGLLGNVGLDRAAIDDLVQGLRCRLLVGTQGREPELARYTGRGRLSSWLRLLATREAIRTRHKNNRIAATGGETPDVVVSSDPGPFVRQLRAELSGPLKAAVARGIEGLTERDRRLLELSIIEDIDSRTLSTRFGVHESTVSRWLTKARAALRRAVRRDLQRSLAVAPWELESILRVFEGNFELTTGTVWRTRTPSPTSGATEPTREAGLRETDPASPPSPRS